MIQMTVSELWNRLCVVVQKTHNMANTSLTYWFGSIHPVSLSETELTLGVPDDFFCRFFTQNYGDMVVEALQTLGFADVEVKYELGYSNNPQDDFSDETAIQQNGNTGLQTSTPRSIADYRKKEEEEHRASILKFVGNCTFDSFVVGEENRYAYMSSFAAAQMQGCYNPMYIYGGSGMGKTHLLKAVYHYVSINRPEAKIYYTTCEDFLNEFVESLKNRTNSEFRNKYRNFDYLLIDDVHHLSGRTQLQEEFFNTFNALYSRGSQIFLTSDKQPSEIHGLEERLVSRFQSGCTSQITQTTFETRLAILRQEQENQRMKFGDDVLNFIAKHITSNIRPLKGALIRLTMISTALGYPASLEIAQKELADMVGQEIEQKSISLETIQKVVAEHYGLQVSDLIGNMRPKNIAEARMIAMYLGRRITGFSQKEIGIAFGGRTHATVIHAIKQVEEMSLKNSEFKNTLLQLQSKLHSC